MSPPTPSLTPALAHRKRWLTTTTGHYLLLGIMLVLLGLLMVYPVAMILGSAFVLRESQGTQQVAKFSFFWFEKVLTDQNFLHYLSNSLLLALCVTVLCNIIALPLALIAQRFQFKGKGLLTGMVLVPMVLPPFVGAIGMKQILGTFGSFTILLQNLGILAPGTGVNWLREGGFGACVAMITLGLYPIAFLNTQAALANIDPAMHEAAQNLGSTRWRNFFRITLPLAMPGIFAGSTIIFIWAFTELGTPLLLDYRAVVSRSIWDDLANADLTKGNTAFAKVVIVLLVSVGAFLLGKLTLGRQTYAMTSKAAVATASKSLGWLGSGLVGLPFVLVSLLAMLPHLGVIGFSLTALAFEPTQWGWGTEGQIGWYRTILPSRFTLAGYEAVFNTPEIFNSILNSLKYSSVSTAIDIVLGIAIAWILVRTTIWGRSLLDALAMLPLAVPGLVMAFGYIAVSQTWPFDPKTALTSANTVFLLLVLAYSVRRLPYLVRAAAGGLQQTSVNLEEAAANLGANPWRVLCKVTVPLIMANLIAGSLLTFSFAMLEVSDSLILAPDPATFPITKTIYQLGTDNSAAETVRNACALGVLAMGLLTVTILVAAGVLGKRLGALFRA
jgi:iron(III) transport system permease protein